MESEMLSIAREVAVGMVAVVLAAAVAVEVDGKLE